jgi:hypothetical protein
MQDSNNSALTLKQFEGEDGIEILIDTSTGESFCSVRGYARMANKDHSTILKRNQVVDGEPQKTAKVHTNGGLQVVALITENQIVEWLPKDNPIAATQLLKMGVRMTLHKMAGYSISSTAVNPEPDRFAELRAQAELAIALAGNPGAIEAYKSLFCAPSVTPPAVQTSPPSLDDEEFLDKIIDRLQTPKTSVKAPMEALPMLQDFFTKLDVLKRKGVCGEWNSTIIYRARKSWIALHMPDIWPKMENYFDMEYTRFQLELAILELGGERRSLQRFIPEEGGEKKTQQRWSALIPGHLDV